MYVLACKYVGPFNAYIECATPFFPKPPSPLQYGGDALQLPFDRQVTFWGPSSRKFFLQR